MTDEPMGAAHERRIAELERRVAALEAATVVTRAAVSAAPRPAPAPPKAPRQAPAWLSWSGEEWAARGEGWLGRGGIALVVAGLIFLFRYAVDRGWVTPELRVLTGLLIGGGLLAAGLRLFEGRERYRQILMGGGVVILFITGLAASELYQLVSGGVALLFHAAVAVGAFLIAARKRDTVMASIAAAGAMIPPAFLLADSVAGPVLWLYLVLVASWSALLAARHEPGPFPVIAAGAALIAAHQRVAPDVATRVAATVAMGTIWLGFAALPLLRSQLRWALPLPPRADTSMALRFAQPLIVTLFLAVALRSAFPPYPQMFETVIAIAAGAFVLLALWLWPRRAVQPPHDPTRRVAQVLLDSDDFAAAAVAAAACAATAAGGFAGPALRALPIAVVAVVAFLIAPRLRAPALGILTHVLFVVLAFGFADGLEQFTRQPAFDTLALSYAGAGALAALIALSTKVTVERMIYAAAVFIVAHTLLATELGAVPNATWLASVSYALVGSGLVVVGLSRRSMLLQRAGLVSLALLVIRLFAYDLATAGVGVRIVLFLATGFAFLGLSYLFRGRRLVD